MMDLLLSPLSWFLAAAAGTWWARRAKGHVRWLHWVAAAATAASLFLMTPLGANLLVGALERHVPPEQGSCSAVPPTTIVVLGGGLDRPPAGEDDLEALSLSSTRRVVAAWQLWNTQPGSRMVIAGGGPFALAESTVMASLARRLGVPASEITTETRSMDTAGNFAALAAMQPPLDRRFWLVSSAMHVPRAVASAHRVGFQPCAWPADPRWLPPGGLGYYLPQSSALEKAEDAIHEIVGLAAYALRSVGGQSEAGK